VDDFGPGAGIRKVVNGPFTFLCSGRNPLIGADQGVRNFWVDRAGVHGGLQKGGRRGVGSVEMAGWTAEPGADAGAGDVARLRATGPPFAYTNAKGRENYSAQFRIRVSEIEELPAEPGRCDTKPIYERLDAENAFRRPYCALNTPWGSRQLSGGRSGRQWTR